jgi:hypothetical protein
MSCPIRRLLSPWFRTFQDYLECHPNGSKLRRIYGGHIMITYLAMSMLILKVHDRSRSDASINSARVFFLGILSGSDYAVPPRPFCC